MFSSVCRRGQDVILQSRLLVAVGGVRQASHETSKKTCLYDFHVANGGKLVDFAGYLMPVQYGKEGIAASHIHTRTHCSVFDVSHMLQTHVLGKDGIKMMERITVADIQGLKDNQGSLTVFTNPSGGIIDDLIVTKTTSGYLYVVSNAGCRHKDIPHMKETVAKCQREGMDVSIEFQEDRGLIAVQGPEMSKILQGLTNVDMSTLKFMTTSKGAIAGVENCRITRCGYTGEDGVEISIPADKTRHVTEAILASTAGSAKMAGLGARDSLRLEAGLCLYGQDIDETTTPIEAGLAWTIGKRRRNLADFPGAEIILRQLKEKPTRRRVGILSRGPPARGHTEILNPDTGKAVGSITSGCPSPSLGEGTNVAMGYVPTELSQPGTKLLLEVRKKKVEASVAKMPFVPTKYFN